MVNPVVRMYVGLFFMFEILPFGHKLPHGTPYYLHQFINTSYLPFINKDQKKYWTINIINNLPKYINIHSIFTGDYLYN